MKCVRNTGWFVMLNLLILGACEESRDSSVAPTPGDSGLYAGPCTIEFWRDGSLNDLETYRYEGEQLVEVGYDEGADGVRDTRALYEYNNDGQVLKEIFQNVGASSTVWWNYDYDPGGLLVREEFVDVDGTVRMVWTHEYDTQRRITKSSLDRENDGVPDTVTAWQYEPGIITETVDTDADLAPDIIRTHYVVAEKIVRTAHDSGADGTVDRIWYTTFDTSGKKIAEAVDNDVDGQIDGRWIYQYDNGRLTSAFHDFPAGGRLERVTSYTYDGAGNIQMVSDISVVADEYVEQLQIHKYACWQSEQVHRK